MDWQIEYSRPDPSISVSVMAHPSRAQVADELSALLGSARVVMDPAPADVPSCVRTSAVAWGDIPRGASHHVVVQDDLEVCNDFRHRVAEAVRVHPTAVVSLFQNWCGIRSQIIRVAAGAGYSWARLPASYASAAANIMPAEIAQAYSEFLKRSNDPKLGSSEQLRQFIADHDIPLVAAIPNLAQHDTRDLKSLLPRGERSGLRRSAYFGTGLREHVISSRTMPIVNEIPYLTSDLWACVDGENRVTGPSEMLAEDRRDCWPWLENHGWTREDLEQLFEMMIQKIRPGAVTNLIGPAALRGIFATALATGMSISINAPLGASGEVREAFGDGGADDWIGTLVPGAFYRVFTGSGLESLAAETLDGVRSVIEIALASWHPSLALQGSRDDESIQRGDGEVGR